MKLLFIHHSTGANLIREGKLRILLKERFPHLEFWDHSYNLYAQFPLLFATFTHHTGLTNQYGKITGSDYNITLSNNSPKEFAEIFSRNSRDSTLSKILDYDIVAFKNCYPTTKIITDTQLEGDKNYYLKVKDSLRKYSTKKWIMFTPPPLRKELTKPEYANRARKLANWLASEEFLQNSKNIFVFNFFDFLANENNYLKNEYCRRISFDSHPNKKANEVIAKEFVSFLEILLK